jgi:hypothetical protein
MAHAARPLALLRGSGALSRSFHLSREQSPDLTRDFQKWPFPLLDTDPSNLARRRRRVAAAGQCKPQDKIAQTRISRSRTGRSPAFVGGNVPPFHELAAECPGFLGGQLKASVGRKGAQNVCDLMAASVRFFAFNFFIIRRTWTLTVVSHMPSS